MKQALDTIRYFFYLGILGFGGPFALIAQMQRDLVEEKKWISMEEFRRALVAIKAMPGPLAHQMVLYLARQRSGVWIAAITGIAFLIPSFLMMVALAAAYDQFENIPMVAGFLSGIQMAAVAVIFVSLGALTEGYWAAKRFWILIALGFLLALIEIPEPIIILLLGGWSLIFSQEHKPPAQTNEAGALFWVCFKAGAFVFGTGYSIIPILQTQFVDTYHWVALPQFKDALAFGMLTPGPVLMTVTFLGYKMGGISYALSTTFAVFLPSFFHHLTWFPRMLDRISKAKGVQVFLVGAIAGVTATIIKSGLSMLHNITTFEAAVFLVSLGLLLTKRYPALLIILLAGVAGAVPYLF